MELKHRVLVKLDEMDRYLHELEELMPSSEEEYVQDLKTKRACEKTVQLAIETVIDMTQMIVSDNRLGVPKSEDDLIDILETKKIISKELFAKVKEMKGFRNILIHKYGEVDDALVYQFLTEEIDDFVLFKREIQEYLRSLNKK